LATNPNDMQMKIDQLTRCQMASSPHFHLAWFGHQRCKTADAATMQPAFWTGLGQVSEPELANGN